MKEIIITATVLILCALLVRRMFRGKISSRMQYALWFLVALRLMIPVSAQIDLGPLARFSLMNLVERAELERGSLQEQLEEPIQMTVNSQSMLYRLGLIGDDVQRAQMEEAFQNMPDDGASVAFLAGTLGFSWLDILKLLWIAGMLTVGLWMIGTNILFSHRLKKSRRPAALSEEEIRALLKKEDGSEIFQKKRKGRLPALYLADSVYSPCLYGFFGREAVYLTEDVTKDSDKLRHVLVHEFVHKKHGDSFWALLRSVLVTIYWFHPLVWVAAVCSKRDCEMACDESALALLGEQERISYGETLLSIITRKGRFSDLVCTATTMTGSGRSVKERIQFIVKKPKVLYAAVAVVVFLMVTVGLFVFTHNSLFDSGVMVDDADGLTVTGADMQIQLPASIGGISGCIVDEESDDVVIYHIKTQKEVGRFSKMTFVEAIGLADAGREIFPIGDQGYNYLLRAYMGEPVTWTEHYYTMSEKNTDHVYTPADGKNQGVLEHEDIYIPAEEEPQGVPGTDSNDDTTYTIPGKGRDYNPMLDKDWEVIPLEEEEAEEETAGETEDKVDYLPNETITTTTYQPREIGADEKDTGCYLYVKADFDGVSAKYVEEMTFIDEELKKTAGDVIILSLNRKRREDLFDALTKNRTPYVGDNSKVGALIEAIPLPPTLNRTDGFSMQTMEEPYSLRFGYEMSTDIFTKEDQDMLYFNAAMLFYAIGNVEEIAVEIKNPSEDDFMMQSYSREDMEEEIPALQNADYENDQIFREKLLEVHAAVEEHLSSVSQIE